MAVCRSCNAQITWAIMPSNAAIPLDADPVEGGNIVIDEHQPLLGELRVRVATPEDAGVRFVSHFATCPQAKAWRR